MSDSFIIQQGSVGKYKIVGRVGQGAMANVYKALHPELDRVVAIKVLNHALVHSPEMRERFRREARAVATLSHPNIVQVFDFDIVDDVYFMVMEFIEGRALNQRLIDLKRRGDRMPLQEVLRVVSAVGHALHYAHEQGMLHRDIKPGNIMFRGDGSVVLTDFGVAKILNVSSEITVTGVVTGTPAYMAPEQWTEDESDRRSDIYSLGVVLYELTTGQLPFQDELPGRLMFKHISEPPPLPRKLIPDIPLDLERVILRSLAKDPRDRYQTARELVDDLESVIYRIESTAPTGVFKRPFVPLVGASGTEHRIPTLSGRPLSRLWLGAGAIVVLAVLVALLVRGSGEPLQAVPTLDITGTALAARVSALESTLAVTPTPSPILTGTPYVITRATSIQESSTPSPLPAPSPTPLTCHWSMGLLQDASYFSKDWWSVVSASFEKIWRLRNDGDCIWPQDTELVHLDGHAFGLDEPLPVQPITPGEELELRVLLTAPDVPGEYEGVFQLQTTAGRSIGVPLAVVLETRPRTTLTRQASDVMEPVRFGGFELFDWSEDKTQHIWRGRVTLWAHAGTGKYVWYRDTLDDPLPGDVLEFEWGICRDFFGSVWVTSGDTQDHKGLHIPYPGSCE